MTKMNKRRKQLSIPTLDCHSASVHSHSHSWTGKTVAIHYTGVQVQVNTYYGTTLSHTTVLCTDIQLYSHVIWPNIFFQPNFFLKHFFCQQFSSFFLALFFWVKTFFSKMIVSQNVFLQNKLGLRWASVGDLNWNLKKM